MHSGFARLIFCVALASVVSFAAIGGARAAPRIPRGDDEVLAELPAGARHSSGPALALISTRLDIALPLAEFDVARARATGDLRFLGYAEATLAPWMKLAAVPPQVLILHATILQSRHAFDASLAELDRALHERPDDAQGWLTRATVLRVLGRYTEAMTSCDHLAGTADASVASLCRQGLRGLTGHLGDAYASIVRLSTQGLSPEIRAWRCSELGEMAERLGNDADAEHWFRAGLQDAPQDFYMKAAYADLLLRHDRAAETLQLLAPYRSMEPMLLRIAIAHRLLRDGAGAAVEALLAGAFDVEELRGDAVHRREQARFLLDVRQQPLAALRAALENWRVQREPDDILILMRAAQAAGKPEASASVREFLGRTELQDSRLDRYRNAI